MAIRRILNALSGQPQETSVYLVWDTSGMGRLVGVFTDPKVAYRIGEVNRPYYRVLPCTLNTINEKIHGWISPEKEKQVYEAAAGASGE